MSASESMVFTVAVRGMARLVILYVRAVTPPAHCEDNTKHKADGIFFEGSNQGRAWIVPVLRISDIL